MKIGQFITCENGNLAGTIPVLFGREKVTLTATGEEGKRPIYSAHLGETDIGAVWRKTSQKGEAYFSFLLDLPSLPAPVWGCLFPDTADATAFNLFWERPKEQKPKQD